MSTALFGGFGFCPFVFCLRQYFQASLSCAVVVPMFVLNAGLRLTSVLKHLVLCLGSSSWRLHNRTLGDSVLNSLPHPLLSDREGPAPTNFSMRYLQCGSITVTVCTVTRNAAEFDSGAWLSTMIESLGK